MSRRTTGTLFILTAAALYATRYLAAAIFGSSASGWNTDLFTSLLNYVGRGLVIWSSIALLVGAAYLVWAEAEAYFTSKSGT